MAQAVGAQSCRAVRVSLGSGGEGGSDQSESVVLIAESPGSLGIGGKVWDSSLVLVDWLARAPSHAGVVRGKRVLELGSGTGLVAICCEALLGAHRVVATDFAEVVKLIRYNVWLNSSRGGDGEVPRVQALPLEWGVADGDRHSGLEGAIRALNGGEAGDDGIDLIVMSDCVYDPVGYEPLLATMQAIVNSCPSASFFMAHRHRHPADGDFFEGLFERFLVSEPTISSRDNISHNHSAPCDERSSSRDVRIFHIRAK